MMFKYTLYTYMHLNLINFICDKYTGLDILRKIIKIMEEDQPVNFYLPED